MILKKEMHFLISREPKNLPSRRYSLEREGRNNLELLLLQQGASITKLDEMLESTFDITEWRMEVERVLPALKFFTRPDNKVISLLGM